MARTVSIGLIDGISGNTPASAILTPLKPRSLSSWSTTAYLSLLTSPIFVVPAGWYTVCATLLPYSDSSSSVCTFGPGATSRLSHSEKGACLAISRAALRPATMVAAS